jgi:hypothetical protein
LLTAVRADTNGRNGHVVEGVLRSGFSDRIHLEPLGYLSRVCCTTDRWSMVYCSNARYYRLRDRRKLVYWHIVNIHLGKSLLGLKLHSGRGALTYSRFMSRGRVKRFGWFVDASRCLLCRLKEMVDVLSMHFASLLYMSYSKHSQE